MRVRSLKRSARVLGGRTTAAPRSLPTQQRPASICFASPDGPSLPPPSPLPLCRPSSKDGSPPPLLHIYMGEGVLEVAILTVAGMGLGGGGTYRKGGPERRQSPSSPYLPLLSPLRMTCWLSELQAERRWQSENGPRARFPGNNKRPDELGQERPGWRLFFSASRTTNTRGNDYIQ